ncbi:hypothetical protein OCK74_27280 [Chitinophagaceae bacterium LB-8]|uniref:DUF3592 domain-containing protein n=1 Tax=Paraflavisolibacter caeni TaxID=2982496 RepID=A0A9X2Y1G3_9BACT|nr:hypothetical protein [Paraflavisolibacter caeni]MCU7552852.1 hypothetical protein [Paraflavisolibacter caeni]
MTKRLRGFLSALFLGGICLIGGIKTIISDTDLDLKKVDNITGPVEVAEIRSRFVKGAKISQTQTVFFFRLYNSDQNFTIYRSNNAYGQLQDNVNIGDTIKVYYEPSSEDFNLDVYQVEKGNNIIHNYSTYNKQVSSAAGIMLLAGTVIVAVAIISYTNFNIWKFLMRLPGSS